MRQSKAALAIATACVLALGACSDEAATPAATEEAAEPGSESLAALVAGDDDLSTVGGLIEEAGLNETFDGNAAYTIFAPTNAAFEALGEEFTGEEARPALLAVLREHIVPGYLTAEDISAAIEAKGGPVQMQTMGSTTLTFSAEGDTVTVSTDGGASAPVTGELRGANGVVVPVPNVLKDLDAA